MKRFFEILMIFFYKCINPLVTDPLYLACKVKISIFKKEWIIEKITYERCAYESVDDGSHS